MLDYIREFSDPLPLIGTEADVDYRNYGYWVVIHYIMLQAGHDWYNETDACLKAMQNRLKSIAHYRGADLAREEYDRLLATWEDHREDLEAWLEENPTGGGEEP